MVDASRSNADPKKTRNSACLKMEATVGKKHATVQYRYLLVCSALNIMAEQMAIAAALEDKVETVMKKN